MAYRLPEQFQGLFDGKRFRHRRSTQGDLVAIQMYEDLLDLGRSPRLTARILGKERGLNLRNTRTGIRARRGDATFGEFVPGTVAESVTGYGVSRGPLATVEIGAEVKILMKSMIGQIDRVIRDLNDQVKEFKRGAGSPICIGIVGINAAPFAVGYEGRRKYRTGGSGDPHPCVEAPKAEARLVADAKPSFDEFLVLRYEATNVPPYPFRWVDLQESEELYGAALTRISREYERRFA